MESLVNYVFEKQNRVNGQSLNSITRKEPSFLHKKLKLPANEIITKDYDLDEKPIIKLLTKEEMVKSEKNLQYQPPKIRNEQFEKYGQEFHISDFVGFQYAERFDEMVYFRFNNSNHNYLGAQSQTTNDSKSSKYFSGLFIELETLASKKIQAYDNIYQALGIDCPGINNSPGQSFSKNSKGCSLDPVFSSNYQSGNLMAAIRKNPFEYDLILQNDTNSRSAEHFNFAVKFIEQGTYTFNIVNLSVESPMYKMGAKIPYFSYFQQSYKTEPLENMKSGSGWGSTGKNISLWKSDLRKQDQIFDQTYHCLTFQYKNKNKQETCIFASSIPYGEIDYERFLNKTLYSRISQHMKSEVIDIGRSIAGANIKAYLFFHRKTKSNTMTFKGPISQLEQSGNSAERHRSINFGNLSPINLKSGSGFLENSLRTPSTNANCPQSIVFLARQHPGETVSSFVLEGIVEFLVDNTQFDIFKKNFNFVVIPFVNPDGVKYGNQRTNLAGSDLAKSWRRPNETFEPQLFQIKAYLKNLNQVNPISLIVNLESNNHTIGSYFRYGSGYGRKDTSDLENAKLFPYICSKRIDQISFQQCRAANSTSDGNDQSSFIKSINECFPKALVYEFSCSNYGWKSEVVLRKHTQASEKEEEIQGFTPDVYRSVGRQLISTYLEFIRLCDKNIGIKDRWLKEIEAIGNFSNDANLYKKSIEQTWSREAVQLPFQQWSDLNRKPKERTVEEAKSLKRMSENRRKFSNQGSKLTRNLGEVRSNSKKRTLPEMKSYSSKLSQKENYERENELSTFDSQARNQIEENSSSSKSNILGQFKNSPLSSNILTPKRRSQVLKQISETFDSEEQTHNRAAFVPKGMASNLMQEIPDQRVCIVKKNDKSVSSKYAEKYRDRAKLKDAIVKFEGMKNFMKTSTVKKVSEPFA